MVAASMALSLSPPPSFTLDIVAKKANVYGGEIVKKKWRAAMTKYIAKV
jgi:hypothetical protein